jgi:hypothetical protein
MCFGMVGYDHSDEQSFKPSVDSTKEVAYGSAYVFGYLARDLVCTTDV